LRHRVARRAALQTDDLLWQRGFRKSSLDEMAIVAKKLNDREIAAVAAYYRQVRRNGDVAASP